MRAHSRIPKYFGIGAVEWHSWGRGRVRGHPFSPRFSSRGSSIPGGFGGAGTFPKLPGVGRGAFPGNWERVDSLENWDSWRGPRSFDVSQSFPNLFPEL